MWTTDTDLIKILLRGFGDESFPLINRHDLIVLSFVTLQQECQINYVTKRINLFPVHAVKAADVQL